MYYNNKLMFKARVVAGSSVQVEFDYTMVNGVTIGKKWGPPV